MSIYIDNTPKIHTIDPCSIADDAEPAANNVVFNEHTDDIFDLNDKDLINLVEGDGDTNPSYNVDNNNDSFSQNLIWGLKIAAGAAVVAASIYYGNNKLKNR